MFLCFLAFLAKHHVPALTWKHMDILCLYRGGAAATRITVNQRLNTLSFSHCVFESSSAIVTPFPSTGRLRAEDFCCTKQLQYMGKCGIKCVFDHCLRVSPPPSQDFSKIFTVITFEKLNIFCLDNIRKIPQITINDNDGSSTHS